MITHSESIIRISSSSHCKGEKLIAVHTLVAVVVMIAKYQPEEMETMVRLVMNFLAV